MKSSDIKFQEAYELFKTGNNLEAYQAFKPLVSSYPYPGEVLWYMGIISVQMGNVDQAILHLQEAIKHEPNNPDYLSELGVTYFHAKDGYQSLYFMDKAVELDSKNPYRYSSRAYIRSVFGMNNEAMADYEMAIKLDPDDSVAYNNLGLLQEQAGWKKMAETNYEQADALEKLKKLVDEDFEEELNENNNSAPIVETPNPVSELQNFSEVSPMEVGQEVAQGPTIWSVMKRIFTDSNTRKEFIDFVKNGFKNKE